MFGRHQAEIAVMQFTGHSLPLHQSLRVPWDFYLVPYFNQPAYAISSHNCHRNVSLPSGASLWNGIFGRVDGQYTTLRQAGLSVMLYKQENPEMIAFNIFPFPKGNVIARLEFELVYLVVVIPCCSHYATGNPSTRSLLFSIQMKCLWHLSRNFLDASYIYIYIYIWRNGRSW